MPDFRSDTVTQPTPAMRAAMFQAPLGDDAYADDPSVNALQEHAAELLRFDAPLFPPPAGGPEPGGCGARSTPSRWKPSPTARCASPTSPPQSSPTTRTLRAPAWWCWRTPLAARCCRRPTWPRWPD